MALDIQLIIIVRQPGEMFKVNYTILSLSNLFLANKFVNIGSYTDVKQCKKNVKKIKQQTWKMIENDAVFKLVFNILRAIVGKRLSHSLVRIRSN